MYIILLFVFDFINTNGELNINAIYLNILEKIRQKKEVEFLNSLNKVIAIAQILFMCN